MAIETVLPSGTNARRSARKEPSVDVLVAIFITAYVPIPEPKAVVTDVLFVW